MNFKIVYFVFFKKQAALKTNFVRLWRFILMITYKYVNSKMLFLLMISEYFQNKDSFRLMNEKLA